MWVLNYIRSSVMHFLRINVTFGIRRKMKTTCIITPRDNCDSSLDVCIWKYILIVFLCTFLSFCSFTENLWLLSEIIIIIMTLYIIILYICNCVVSVIFIYRNLINYHKYHYDDFHFFLLWIFMNNFTNEYSLHIYVCTCMILGGIYFLEVEYSRWRVYAF